MTEKSDIQDSMRDFFEKEKRKVDSSRVIDETKSEHKSQIDENKMESFFKERAAEFRTKSPDDQKHFATTKKFFKTGTDPRNAFTQKGLSEREKEQMFLHFYDENLKLKERDTALEQKIKELKTKLRVLEGEFMYTKRRLDGDRSAKEDLKFMDELKTENLSLKKQLDEMRKSHKIPALPGKTQKILVKSTNNKPMMAKTSQEHQRLIDLLKAQLRKAEAEIESLHTQLHQKGTARADSKDLPSGSTKFNQARLDNLDHLYNTQKNSLEKTKQMLEEANMQAIQDKNRIAQLETQLRAADIGSHSAKELQAQLDDANRTIRKLEATIKDLSMTPFFRDLDHAANPERLRNAENEVRDLTAKNKSLSDENSRLEKYVNELKQANEKANFEREKLKEETSKLQAILHEREKNKGFLEDQMKLLHLDSEDDKDNFMKALGLVKLKGQEPAWLKLDFIERAHELNMNDIPTLLKEIDRLRMEKSELAAQLEKAQTLLKTHMDIEREKQIINETERQKLELQLKSAQHRIEELAKLSDFRRHASYGGYQSDKLYDDAASEFSDITESELHAGENTFDLFIGECELDDFTLKKIVGDKVSDVRKIQTLVTVDFYNHDTQSSNIIEGLRPYYNFQLGFRVMVDDFFIRYLEADSFRVELYASVGSEVTLLGYVSVPLKDLVLKNFEVPYGTSAVVTTAGVLQGILRNEVLGVVKMRFRMRHPIIDTIRWYREKNELIGERIADTKDILMDPTITTRKVVVNVVKGHGFDPRSSTFVYYKFFNTRDTYTTAIPGKDPVYDSIHTHDIPYNQSLKNYLKNEYIEFLVFDDSVPYRSPEGDRSNIPNDVVGVAKLKLVALLDDSPIDEVVPVYNMRGNRVGEIVVKIYWYDVNVQRDNRRVESKLTNVWEENLTQAICETLRNKRQNVESAFQIFDADSDGYISFDDFRATVMGTFKIRVREDELATYWNKLQLQHVKMTEKEFQAKFGPYLDVGGRTTKTEDRSDNLKDNLQRINAVLGRNTEELKRNINEDPLSHFISSIANRIVTKKISLDEAVSGFDRNTDGYITLPEFKNAAMNFIADLTARENEQVFKEFDRNNTGRVRVNDLKDYLRSRVQTHVQLIGEEKKTESQQITDMIIEAVCMYMRKEHLSIHDIYKMIDRDNDSNVTRVEFAQFLRRMGLTPSDSQIDDLIKAFDKDRNGRIKFSEFVDAIKARRVEAPPVTLTVQDVLEQIGTFMVEQNIPSSKLFVELDGNKDGFISRMEFERGLTKLGFNIDSKKFEEVYKHFDYSRDGKLSVKEFIDVVAPYYEKAQKTASTTIKRPGSTRQLQKQGTQGVLVESLRKKVRDVVRENYKNLNMSFQMFAEPGTSFMTKENFKKVILESKVGITATEAGIILENFVEYNGKDEVNYVKFLSSFNEARSSGTLDNIRMEESRVIDTPLKRSSTAKNIFGTIAKIIEQGTVTKQGAFKIFDKDNSGKISHKEFKEAFNKGMGMNLTDYELDVLIKEIDKDGNGTISYNEFCAALKL